MSHKIIIIKTFESLVLRLGSGFSKLAHWSRDHKPVFLFLFFFLFFLQRQGNFSKLTLN